MNPISIALFVIGGLIQLAAAAWLVIGVMSTGEDGGVAVVPLVVALVIGGLFEGAGMVVMATKQR